MEMALSHLILQGTNNAIYLFQAHGIKLYPVGMNTNLFQISIDSTINGSGPEMAVSILVPYSDNQSISDRFHQ